jgi:hypothetical protein
MTALVHQNLRQFPNNKALAPYLRVTLDGFLTLVESDTDAELGILERRTLASDTVGTVRMPSFSDTVRVTAAGPIPAFTEIYPAFGGKVTATPGGTVWGISLEAASGNGSVIEALRRFAS